MLFLIPVIIGVRLCVCVCARACTHPNVLLFFWFHVGALPGTMCSPWGLGGGGGRLSVSPQGHDYRLPRLTSHPGGDASLPGTWEGTLPLGRLLAGGARNRPTNVLSHGRAGEWRGELAGTRGVTPDPPPHPAQALGCAGRWGWVWWLLETVTSISLADETDQMKIRLVRRGLHVAEGLIG